MNESVIETLTALTAINSPSGNADRAIAYVQQTVEAYGYNTQLTRNGGLLIEVKGDDDTEKNVLRRM